MLEAKADSIGEDPTLFLQNILEQSKPRTVELKFSDVEYIKLENLFRFADASNVWGENLKKWIVNKTRGEDIASISRTLRKR